MTLKRQVCNLFDHKTLSAIGDVHKINLTPKILYVTSVQKFPFADVVCSNSFVLKETMHAFFCLIFKTFIYQKFKILSILLVKIRFTVCTILAVKPNFSSLTIDWNEAVTTPFTIYNFADFSKYLLVCLWFLYWWRWLLPLLLFRDDDIPSFVSIRHFWNGNHVQMKFRPHITIAIVQDSRKFHCTKSFCQL